MHQNCTLYHHLPRLNRYTRSRGAARRTAVSEGLADLADILQGASAIAVLAQRAFRQRQLNDGRIEVVCTRDGARVTVDPGTGIVYYGSA